MIEDKMKAKTEDNLKHGRFGKQNQKLKHGRFNARMRKLRSKMT